MATALPVLQNKKKSYYKQAFLYSLIVAAIIFTPFIIHGKGIYIHYGDYNVQQIPFYQLAHKAVKSGNVFWNWNTDLGANFIGSYSFYLLFSPFFWLTLPFPNVAVPYLMGPLLILKTACASFTAYLYLERFVKDSYYAVIGGMLYAFSGWMTFNIFFNHFHDVAVFFPLLLLGVEKLITEDRKFFFALSVAINAMVNYWFFVGEVVFVIIYVIVRTYSRSWNITFKKFFHLALESILGFLLASFAVIPSVLAITGNPRTDFSHLLYGWGLWIYWHNFESYGEYAQRVPAILSSIVLPPELAAKPNFFADHGAQWSSLSAWLPMFSTAGVIAYFTQKKNNSDWLKKILALCLTMSLIPALNHLFVLLNNSYYARWFYMPILLMSLASIIALENSISDIQSFKAGIKWTAIIASAITFAIALSPDKIEGNWTIGLAKEPLRIWIWYAVLILGLVILALCVVKYRYYRSFKRLIALCLAIFCAGFGIMYLLNARLAYPRKDNVLNKALGGRGKIAVPKEPFARSDIYEDDDNLLMYWELPAIQAFHSIVPASIMEFYPEVGVSRAVASRPEWEDYALRSLLSTRWLFIDQQKEIQNPLPGYSYYDNQHGYNIYQNENYIPMGFTYDYCITPQQLQQYTYNKTAHLMLKAVVLQPEDCKSNADILSALPDEQYFDMISFYDDVKQRKSNTVDNFTITKTGFHATSNFENSELVFFSVPFEKGWSAYINGSPAEIFKANIGFMAVRVPSGEVNIEFNYMTPGLIVGLSITIIVATALVIWYIVERRRKIKKPIEENIDVQQKIMDGQTVTLSWDEYLQEFDTKARKQKLRDALEDAENQKIIQEVENFDFYPNSKEREEDND